MVPSAAVPMQKVVQSTAQAPSDTLLMHVWYGKEGASSSYYEDDGSTYAFEKGAFLRRNILFDPARREVTVASAEGSYTSKFSSVRAILHGFPADANLSIDGKSVPAGARSAVVPFLKGKITLHW